MGAKTELSAVQKDGISALDELKSTDKLISESLKAELDRLREELAFVSNERESQKTQLIDALLAKDKFRKDAEEAKELQETAALSTANQDSSESAKKATEKIEKLRDRLIERKQVSLTASPFNCLDQDKRKALDEIQERANWCVLAT